MNEYTIEQLAAIKPFSTLDAEEKALVLSETTAEAYEDMHRLLNAFARMDRDAAPPAALRARLGAHPKLKQTPAISTGVRTALAAAAAFMAGMCFMAFWKREGRVEHVPAPVPKIVFQRDTIILRDTVRQTRILWRERAKTPVAVTEPDIRLHPTTAGASLGDMPALMDFLGAPQEKI